MRASGLVQSLLVSHSLGHVSEQIPLQQSSPLEVLQSDDSSQAFGHYSELGFRHRPSTARWGSTFFTVVQQTSSLPVSQSSLDEHACGHWDGARQNGWS